MAIAANHTSDYASTGAFADQDNLRASRLTDLGCLDTSEFLVAGSVQKIDFELSVGFVVAQRLCLREQQS